MAADNIVEFTPIDAAKDPDVVLEKAKGSYKSVLILGWDKEGYLDPRASLNLTGREMLWLVEVFKTKLVAGDYDNG